jgi:hypothetical protein
LTEHDNPQNFVVLYFYKGMYHVQTEFLCNHRANEVTMFIKKSENFTNVLLIILHLYIKVQDQIHRNEREIKKTKFLTDLISQICQKFLFFDIVKL